jgi:hypothetical protein
MTAHVSIPAIEEQQHELVMQMGNQPCSGERRRAKPTHTSLHVSYYKQTHDTKQKAGAGSGECKEPLRALTLVTAKWCQTGEQVGEGGCPLWRES